MEWSIDPQDPRPPFEQLRVLIVAGIASGELPTGTRLPTVRDLAARCGIAVNTAARTYRELESSGAVETKGRAGTFVRAASGSFEEAAVTATRAYVDQMRELGFSCGDIVTRVRAICDE